MPYWRGRTMRFYRAGMVYTTARGILPSVAYFRKPMLHVAPGC